jgi:hypothetical protein
MEGCGGKGLGAIKCDEQLMVQNAAWIEQVLLCKVGKDLEKDGVEIAWRNGIKERAEVIVTRDWRDAEEGLRVVVSLPLVG